MIRPLMCLTFLCLVLGLFILPASAQEFSDQHQHPQCHYCGMNRVKFGHSRMLVKYKDGSEVGTCSLHCMALEYASSISRIPIKLLVADYNSGELLDVNDAFWIIGGDKRGVMTARAKWAFHDKAQAETFIASHGGVLASFDDALKASYEDMYADVQRIRKMRAMKMQKMEGK